MATITFEVENLDGVITKIEVPKVVAMMSSVYKNMIEDCSDDISTIKIPIRICEYQHYNNLDAVNCVQLVFEFLQHYHDNPVPDVTDQTKKHAITEYDSAFIKKFMAKFIPEKDLYNNPVDLAPLMELTKMADYMDIEHLRYLCIADKDNGIVRFMRGRSIAELSQQFRILTDWTQEELDIFIKNVKEIEGFMYIDEKTGVEDPAEKIINDKRFQALIKKVTSAI
jgi:hypothetical protein